MLAKLCLLTSAGIESTAMMAKAKRDEREAEIAYLQFGFCWEETEKSYLEKLIDFFALAPCTTISAEGVYEKKHWGVSGLNVPHADTPDEAVMLPFRNLLLIALVLPYCLKRDISEIWLGSLKSNPFPDASSSFFKSLQETIALASGKRFSFTCPFRHLHKKDLLLEYPHLPYSLTFSCISPQMGKHCGCCNKCAERKRAFAQAGIVDPTSYA